MTCCEKHKVKKEELIEKIFNSFLNKGYSYTPISQIASSLNLTKAGLYHYFNSKEQLLFIVQNYGVERNLIPILKESEKIADPEERIRFFLKQYTIKIPTQNSFVKIAIKEIKMLNPGHQKKIYKHWRRVFYLLHNALYELERSGRIKKINKSFATYAAIGMCNWASYWFDFERKDSAAELADTYIEIFLNGILAAD